MVLNGKHYSPWICMFMYFPIEYHGFGIPSPPSSETPGGPRSPRCWCPCSERRRRFPRCSVSHRCCKVHHDLATETCDSLCWDDLGVNFWEILKSPKAQTSWVGLPKIPANLLGSCPRRKASEPNSRLLWPAQVIAAQHVQLQNNTDAMVWPSVPWSKLGIWMFFWGMVLGTPTHNVEKVYSILYNPLLIY